MQEIIAIIAEQWAIWVPSLAAVLSMLVGIIPTIVKVKDGLAAIKETQEFKEMKEQLAVVAAENQELIRCNKLLIDKIARIEGYSDAVKKE